MPTWRGCLAFILVFLALTIGLGRGLHSFLSLNETVGGGSLAVEGWASDYSMEMAVIEFKRGGFEKIYVTGGPIEWGAPLSEYKTYAERGAAVLLKLGMATNLVQAVPAGRVRADRTYAAAVALNAWVREHKTPLSKLQVISEGPHARRSRLLFAQALGRGVQVGVTAVPVSEYDPQKWWRSSAGVRGVIGELLAYGYARFLFWGGEATEPAADR
ncbi:MAG TPA: ElyC/SanA/YdcF family protein [Verrucomicrobiae bacterium]